MLKGWQNHGKRIHVSDQHLVYRFACLRLAGVMLVVMGMFHARWLAGLNFDAFSLFELSSFFAGFSVFWFVISVAAGGCVCAVLAYFYDTYRVDSRKQMQHRQALARMILENGWYESATVENAGFWKDLSGKSKQRITHFPKMYYRLKGGILTIRVGITMGSHQEQLLKLEKKLETGLFCEMIDKQLQDGFVVYTLLYDTICRRICIDEVKALDGEMKLMENVTWRYDAMPHMLISGGTGGGKTYFILTLIYALVKTKAQMYILDPKNADLADLHGILPHVYHEKEAMVDFIGEFYNGMMERNTKMKKMENYKTGENYAYLGLEPHFLIFDEYVAFLEMLDNKTREFVLSKIKQIVMLGRQSGYFLILAMQRADSKYLVDGIRDQFNFRVALGRVSEMGYHMMFGETDKEFYLKPIKGRGYLDCGTSVIREFYTPIVPKGFDFLEEIGRLQGGEMIECVT